MRPDRFSKSPLHEFQESIGRERDHPFGRAVQSAINLNVRWGGPIRFVPGAALDPFTGKPFAQTPNLFTRVHAIEDWNTGPAFSNPANGSVYSAEYIATFPIGFEAGLPGIDVQILQESGNADGVEADLIRFPNFTSYSALDNAFMQINGFHGEIQLGSSRFTISEELDWIEAVRNPTYEACSLLSEFPIAGAALWTMDRQMSPRPGTIQAPLGVASAARINSGFGASAILRASQSAISGYGVGLFFPNTIEYAMVLAKRLIQPMQTNADDLVYGQGMALGGTNVLLGSNKFSAEVADPPLIELGWIDNSPTWPAITNGNQMLARRYIIPPDSHP